jgi:Zn-dependent protease with chaperone function/uncharacterized tellurite resistance protein B-like protein
MRFREGQEQARRATGSLIFYFVLGFLGVVAMMVLATMLVLMPVQPLFRPPPEEWAYYPFRWILFWVGLGTALFMLLSSWAKIRSLKQGGGEAVALALGGRMVRPDTPDPLERRLCNVVEEMAIASGTPTPLIFLLHEEQGINAFVAGFHQEYSVFGITRGALELFNREELQAVAAHEFSHIRNSDMRLNLRLVGLVHGIVSLALTGHALLRLSLRSTGDSQHDAGFVPGFIVGVILATVGFVGGFFGTCIKAGVCRQREFLADAAAVQFTRNPPGLVRALEKIGGCPYGSLLLAPRAPMASHMYFASGVFSWLDRLLATHPSLEERIRRIDPTWEGVFPTVNAATRQSVLSQAKVELASLAGASAFAPRSTAAFLSGTPGIQEAHTAFVRHAGSVTDTLPASVVDAARRSGGAPLVIYALLLCRGGMSEQQALRDVLLELLDINAFDAVERLAADLAEARSPFTLPLLDISLPSLHSLPLEERSRFLETVETLVRADKRQDLFEWMLLKSLARHLGGHDAACHAKSRPTPLAELIPECAVLLSALAHWGLERKGSDCQAASAFAVGATVLFPETTPVPVLSLLPPEKVSLRAVDNACEALSQLSEPRKRRLLEACVACVTADALVTAIEAELLRAVADILGLPKPPFLPGQPLHFRDAAH